MLALISCFVALLIGRSGDRWIGINNANRQLKESSG
jgi:hypothetical protein